MSDYILGIDQSTSGTKAVLFDEAGKMTGRADLPHAQKISPEGWVSHDPMEIYQNVNMVVRQLIARTGIKKEEIIALGISNQRETALVWDRNTGLPLADAVVWQCGRGEAICQRLQDQAQAVQDKTGLPLSPYFSAAKLAWILEHTNREKAEVCLGTIDSWLVFQLTNGAVFQTDYSNASRTQLFNIHTLEWDAELCSWFGIDPGTLPQVSDSNGFFGETDFAGYLPKPIPICGVMGDSHGALFGQGCVKPGMLKATYGTGSSVMMHIGQKPVRSQNGLVTSLAWGLDGKVQYVLEGNINYTGSVIKWLVDDMQLIASAKEAGNIAAEANPQDTTYLVPAFTGLGAPHWKPDVKAMLCGMGRSTGRAEIVKAAEECIAYQIADIVAALRQDTGIDIEEIRVDGGPARDSFLMQFQSDILHTGLSVPEIEELSVSGAAYAAGIKAGLYDTGILDKMGRRFYAPVMGESRRQEKYSGWKQAVAMLQ